MDVATFKEDNRAMWAAGDYDLVAERIWVVGRPARRANGHSARRGRPRRRVRQPATLRFRPPSRAPGSSASILTPELFERGARAPPAPASRSTGWKETPKPSLSTTSVDVVVSTFGSMFTPRHQVAAREMARVLRPGGRLGIAAWTPEGVIGDFFGSLAGHLPALAAVRLALQSCGAILSTRARSFSAPASSSSSSYDQVDFRFDSVQHAVERGSNFGPSR